MKSLFVCRVLASFGGWALFRVTKLIVYVFTCPLDDGGCDSKEMRMSRSIWGFDMHKFLYVIGLIE